MWALLTFVVDVVVVVVVLTLTRIIKSVVTGQAPVALELGNTPGKNTNQRWYTHISELTHFMPPPESLENVDSESRGRGCVTLRGWWKHLDEVCPKRPFWVRLTPRWG